jgi:hypothetical protein
MLELVPIVNAHTPAYWPGHKTERLNAKSVYDFKSCFEQYTSSVSVVYKCKYLNATTSGI